MLAAESHTVIPLPIPLASKLESKQVDPGNLCMKVFSTKLVDGDHSGVSACLPDVYIEISVYSTVNCVSRPLSVTAAEMQRQENILPWCFLQFYYTFTEMCSFRL